MMPTDQPNVKEKNGKEIKKETAKYAMSKISITEWFTLNYILNQTYHQIDEKTGGKKIGNRAEDIFNYGIGSVSGERVETVKTDSVRKTLNKYLIMEIIKKFIPPKPPKKIQYFPKETMECFTILTGLMSELMNNGKYESRDSSLLYSNFTKLFVNRQLILEVFRRRGVRFTITVNIDGKDEEIEFPLVGRYGKIYENDQIFSSLLSEIRKYRQIISDRLIDFDSLGISKNDKQKLALNRLSDAVIPGLEILISAISEKRERCRKLSEEAPFSGKENTQNVFDLDPTGDLRRESIWGDLILSPEDESKIRDIGRGKYTMTSEEYRKIVEEKIMIPVLCLIQASPRSLLYFVSEEKWDFSSYITSEPQMDNLAKNIKLNLSNGRRFGFLLYKLVLKTIEDYQSFIQINLSYPSALVYFGNVKIEGEYTPSLLTFGLNDGRFVVYSGGDNFINIPRSKHDTLVKDISEVNSFIKTTIFSKESFTGYPMHVREYVKRFRSYFDDGEEAFRILKEK